MKLHLDVPQAEKTDRQSLLDFFDYFPQNPKFEYIKETNFVLRPVHLSKRSTKVINRDVKEFGVSKDMVNYGESNGDKRSDGKDLEPWFNRHNKTKGRKALLDHLHKFLAGLKSR